MEGQRAGAEDEAADCDNAAIHTQRQATGSKRRAKERKQKAKERKQKAERRKPKCPQVKMRGCHGVGVAGDIIARKPAVHRPKARRQLQRKAKKRRRQAKKTQNNGKNRRRSLLFCRPFAILLSLSNTATMEKPKLVSGPPSSSENRRFPSVPQRNRRGRRVGTAREGPGEAGTGPPLPGPDETVDEASLRLQRLHGP